MAIKTKEVVITEGSDEGKTFVVSQMPLLQGDRWANRAALAILRSGVDVSELKGIEDGSFTGLMDIAGIVNVVLKALGGIDEHTAQQLLDELMSVVKVKLPDGSTRSVIAPTDTTSGDISEISTLWKIRIEAIKVNLDFLMAGVTQ